MQACYVNTTHPDFLNGHKVYSFRIPLGEEVGEEERRDHSRVILQLLQTFWICNLRT